MYVFVEYFIIFQNKFWQKYVFFVSVFLYLYDTTQIG